MTTKKFFDVFAREQKQRGVALRVIIDKSVVHRNGPQNVGVKQNVVSAKSLLSFDGNQPAGCVGAPLPIVDIANVRFQQVVNAPIFEKERRQKNIRLRRLRLRRKAPGLR